MIFKRLIFGPSSRAALSLQTTGVFGSAGNDAGACRSFHALCRSSHNSHTLSGLIKNFEVLKTVSLSSALSFQNYIHSGKPTEVENETISAPGSMDYVMGLLQDYRNNVNGRRMGYPGFQESGDFLTSRRQIIQPQVETNADVVHIKLMRNNTFVTVTDSKGNTKFGSSAGQVAGKGGKVGRYAGEAAAEEIGRKVKQMKIKSVVMKVKGYTFFRRKKDAILGFKDGYTNSRGDMNPVVYIEDTTRKAHNGCRLPKKRRI